MANSHIIVEHDYYRKSTNKANWASGTCPICAASFCLNNTFTMDGFEFPCFKLQGINLAKDLVLLR